jgi:hypothetical protein
MDKMLSRTRFTYPMQLTLPLFAKRIQPKLMFMHNYIILMLSKVRICIALKLFDTFYKILFVNQLLEK